MSAAERPHSNADAALAEPAAPRLPSPAYFAWAPKERASDARPAFAFSEACMSAVCSFEEFPPRFARQAWQSAAAEGSPVEVFALNLVAESSFDISMAREQWLMMVVLSGTLDIAVVDQEPSVGKTWDAIYVEGKDVELRARVHPATLVLAASKPLPRTEKDRRSDPHESLPRPPIYRNFSTASHLSWAGGAYHAYVLFGGQTPTLPASLTLLWAAPNSSIPSNVHTEHWEHLAILRGSGSMVMGKRRAGLSAGNIYHVPPTVEHGFESDGSSELVALQWFSPPGPEKRFFDLSKIEGGQ